MEVLHDPLLGRNSSPFPCGRSRVVRHSRPAIYGKDQMLKEKNQ